MLSDIAGGLPNYYEALNVNSDVALTELQRAFRQLTLEVQERLNHPLTMQQALWMQKNILPGIQTHLLSSPEARLAYNQQLALQEKMQSMRDQLADNEGLDEELEQPFLFDPIDGYDKEMSAAFTLREIAHKLDAEWGQARQWITDETDETHVFVGFLQHIAKRPHLAHRIDEIINAVTPRKQTTAPSQPQTQQKPMDTNEGIERCITLLDPDIDRPTVEICSEAFDGSVFYAGEFISDQPAQTQLCLTHAGIRGCIFGTVESRSAWIRLNGGATSVRFSLLPEGTETTFGPTQTTVQLFFNVARLPRNAEHIGEILLRMENHPTVQEISVKVLVAVAPLPPRVSFEPSATANNPLTLGVVRRGTAIRAVLTPRNAGDQALIPLSGRVFTQEKGVSVSPSKLHANEPITCTIDTSTYPYGNSYQVTLYVQYDQVSRALGPTTLHMQGAILPTPWQSMLRKRSFGERLGIACLGGLAGGTIGLLAGQWVYERGNNLFLVFLLMPVLLLLLVRWVAHTITLHIRQAGNANAHVKQIHPLALWGLPLLTGILFPIIGLTLSDRPQLMLFAICFCCMIGGIASFCLD